MTRDDGGGEEMRDVRFERALLESGRGDELPEGGAAAAWSTFSTAAATLATAIPMGADHEGVRPPPDLPAAGWGPALRWIAVGAIGGALGGAALTGLWLRRAPSAPRPAQTTTAASPPRAPTPPTSSEPPAAVAQEAPPAGHPSALAAEVRALDAARAALARGASDEALARIARYLSAFPRGELRADAEVVALEALATKGDRPALERRAARFLHRQPNDPHAARVRRLVEASSATTSPR
jgi:TolA-binding protein